MSTTVSHPIPTAQAQAIADLTGYEDAATLRWQQACVQAANTLTALPNGRYVAVRMERIRQGLELAQRGAVTLPEDGEELSAVVRSGSNLSQVDTRLLTCTCADYQKHLQACKHLLAVEIHLGALGLLPPCETEPLTPPCSEPATSTNLPAPVPLTRIDNPAGCNLKFRIGPNELWFTLHDRSDEALLARLRTTLPLLQDIVEACEQRKAAAPPAAEPSKTTPPPAPAERTLDEQIAAAVQAAIQAQTAASANGQRQPPTPEAHPPATAPQDAKDSSWCPTHQATMRWHDGNARGPGWLS